MPSECISYQNSGYFTRIILDYLNQEKALQHLYHRFPDLENFKLQIQEKQQQFTEEKRKNLHQALLRQYAGFEISELTKSNINSLKESNTFTVTTGHQLNLFTGPLYFLYKIISTINLCKILKSAYPENNFVPVYWMATEDHDFDEINYFILHGKKIRWNTNVSGAVGRINTHGLDEISKIFDLEIGGGKNAEYLKELFKKSYLEHSNLTDATRFLANEIFQKYGLVIIDGDDISLKKALTPIIQKEIHSNTSFLSVTETINSMKDYPIQVNPREINLFYIQNHIRERIIEVNGNYKINHTDIWFTKEEILKLSVSNPEKFSPNVIIRPLYQELILPNLCYIGGGGELAYWFELKNYFAKMNVPFPILLLRNSAILIEEKQTRKIEKLGLEIKDFFLKQQELINKKTEQLSQKQFNFDQQKIFLKKQFEQLFELVKQTDDSFSGAVKAQETKQVKGLDNLEKRFFKAEKRKFKAILDQIIELQNELFPNQGLQERQTNFSEFYAKYGAKMIEQLIDELQPLNSNFNIVILS